MRAEPATGDLDPDRDYVRIFRLSFDVTFGWEVTRALELAIFHTFAAPRISELLDRTGEFAQHGRSATTTPSRCCGKWRETAPRRRAGGPRSGG